VSTPNFIRENKFYLKKQVSNLFSKILKKTNHLVNFNFVVTFSYFQKIICVLVLFYYFSLLLSLSFFSFKKEKKKEYFYFILMFL